MKISLALLVLCAFLAGCAGVLKPETRCAPTPAETQTTVTRFVPIDGNLTAPIPDPGPQIKPGITYGGVLNSAVNRGAALDRANAKLNCIASVQARPVQVAAPSLCGTEIPQKERAP